MTAPTPDGLGPSGAQLWTDLTERFELEPQELAVLHEACRVRDRLDALDADVLRDGTTVSSPQGLKAHPSLVESRAQAVALARLVASLRLPDEDDARPQRRGGTRGVYSIARGGNGGPRAARPGPRVSRG